MMGSLGQDMKRKMARQFLESEKADAVINVATTVEHDLLDELQRTHDLLGIDHLEDVPDPDDRRALLREMWLALVDGRFPEWWVANCCTRIENPEEAKQYANLSEEEWEEQKTEWADRYRRNGVDGDDDELAAAHVRQRHDVPLRVFRHLVVTWPEGRVADELERVAAAGVRTAHEGLQQVNAELEQREGVAEG